MTDLTFNENPLVAALVPNAGDPPELVFLEGFLGRSSRTGYLRLYTTVLMNGWLDIPYGRVKRLDQRAPQEGFPFGTDLLWLENDKLSAAGVDSVYPGGFLSSPADAALMAVWPSAHADDGDRGGGDPAAGPTKIPAPPFR